MRTVLVLKVVALAAVGTIRQVDNEVLLSRLKVRDPAAIFDQIADLIEGDTDRRSRTPDIRQVDGVDHALQIVLAA